MIWESSYWKEDLLKLAQKLRARSKQRKWPQRSLANVEKEVFFAFFAIRKLIEAKKLSDKIANRAVRASSFASRGRPVTYMNWHRLDRLYDLASPRAVSLRLPFLCNQIIHSYAFSTEHAGGGGLSAILFCSDRKRNRSLYRLSLCRILRLLSDVGRDYAHSAVFNWDPAKKDYTVHLTSKKQSGASAPTA